MQKYSIQGIIGGSKGAVMKCRCNDSKEIVAIKKFIQTQQKQIKKGMIREIKMVKMFHHSNIIQMKQVFQKKGHIYLVFEYVENNLLQILQKSPHGLKSQIIRLVIYQLLKGLAYMHSFNIFHRDIKPENLLINSKNELKICDFGFARRIKKGEQQLTDYVGNRWYRAPQLLLGSSYGKQVDLWAVGCIFGELIDGNPMFGGETELDQLFLIQKFIGPLTYDQYESFQKNEYFAGIKFGQFNSQNSIEKRYFDKICPMGLNLLKQLLKMNPSERISAKQAINHNYFDDIRKQDDLKQMKEYIDKEQYEDIDFRIQNC